MDYDPLASAYQRNREASAAVVTELRESAGLDQRARVLEVGCGTGNHIIPLQQEIGCRAHGLDRSAAMLEYARARDSAVELRRGTAERLDFADQCLDLIYSVDVIHHLENRAAFFAEVCRCLVPGGRLATFTHSHEMIARGGGTLRRYFPETVAPDQARYPAIGTLRREMEAAGFRDLAEAVVASPITVTDSRAYAEKAYSSLHLIPEDAFTRGLDRLERDLAQGPISATRRHLVLWGRRDHRS